MIKAFGAFYGYCWRLLSTREISILYSGDANCTT